jgi:chromosome segregation ATPase
VVGPLLTEIGESIEHAQTELSELNRNIESLLSRIETMPDMVRRLRGSLEELAPEATAA